MLKRIFTWWNGATIGALLDIGRRGAFVGEDEQGNRYFEERRASIEGRKRRFTAIKGEIPSPMNPPTGCHFHPRCPHAMPRCAQEAPALREIAPGHISACHLNAG